MLKVIPVEVAVGLPLAHDITEIVPGKHKGPASRRGHISAPGETFRSYSMLASAIFM